MKFEIVNSNQEESKIIKASLSLNEHNDLLDIELNGIPIAFIGESGILRLPNITDPYEKSELEKLGIKFYGDRIRVEPSIT